MKTSQLKLKTTKLIFNNQLYEVDLQKACAIIKQHSNQQINLSDLGQIIRYLHDNNLFSHTFLTPVDDEFVCCDS